MSGGGAPETPFLRLDRVRLERNIARMEARCRALGVAHRPHLKTAKSADVAARIPAATRHGATVSTVREAEHFAAHGVRDLLYAVGIEPSKLARLAALVDGGTRLWLAVDHPATVAMLADAWPRLTNRPTGVLVEVDSGEHRSGLEPDDPQLVAVAAAVHASPALELGGVFTHAGHSYGARSAEAIRRIAADERDAAVAARDAMHAAGLPCGIVSVGSTPTAVHAADYAGCTEVRAGVYVFGDLFQAAMGSHGMDDLALSVVTTVIGHQPAQRRIVIDAGGLALSKDRSTAALGSVEDAGFGLVCADDGEIVTGMRVVDAYQEHGMVALPPERDVTEFPIGIRLRVLPNHACMTAAAHDRYHVVDASGALEAVWPRVNGW